MSARRRRRHGLGALLFIVLASLSLSVGTYAADYRPLLGLDLQGGVSVVLRPVGDANGEALDQAVKIIRRRVDALGVAEPEIARQGDTIVVQIPGVKDPDRALDLVGQTAELRFRPVINPISEAELQALREGIEQTPTTSASPAEPTATTGSATTDTTSAAGDTSTTGATTTVLPAEPASETTAIEGPADTVLDQGSGDGQQQGMSSGEFAAAQVATTQVATTQVATTQVATTQVATVGPTTPSAPPTTVGTDSADPTATSVAGSTATTAPPDTGAVPTTVPPVTLPEIDPAEMLAQYDLTPPEEDEPEKEVVLPQYDDEGNIVIRYALGPARLTGDALESASAGLEGSAWVVRPVFRSGAEGIELFNSVAAECFAKGPGCPTGQLAITLDGEVISAPGIQAASFQRDQIQISGEFGQDEAEDVALVLNYGALPIELEAQQSQIVSATLGTEALRAGIVAGIIGVALAALYMIFFYRLLGLVAMLSLMVSGGLLWGIIAWLGESQGLALTLAGITGIVVSIGISLDSNVVYYENIKEDVRSGRTVRSAVDRGFTTAFATIVKADVASLIGATLLYLLTVGAVRGFAFYLGLATVLDLVASWFFMRPLASRLAASPRLSGRQVLLGIPESGREQ